ncbi:MAG: protein arginine kinase [Planctomycetota bacterium]
MKLQTDVSDLAEHSGEWLKGTGPESDIVISTRIRLARNLADFPFIRRCSDEDRLSIERNVRAKMEQLPHWEQIRYIDIDQLSEIDRQFMVERQLISREIADADGSRGVAIDPSERYSVMVNEEDHLRIQVMHSGLDLDSAWDQINQIDDQLESAILYAFHPKYGYLTACPTNVGTGLRVSVMLHLPGLVVTGEIEKVFRSMQRINVTVRGLYGEGSQYTGDFYQVSNQVTLGHSEQDLLKLVGHEVVPRIIEYERKARDFLIDQGHQDLHDDVSRALGILSTAKKISSEETMHYLSKVRMGVHLGLIDDVQTATLNKLFIHTQPAHLQKLHGGLLTSSDRNVRRASYLQRHLSGKKRSDGELN